MTDSDWAARIIDPIAFETAQPYRTVLREGRREVARTKAMAIVETAREEWITYADKLEKVLELVAGASSDELKKMQAQDGLRLVRPGNSSEQT